MKTLHIDLETYSSVPIKSGLYKYVQSRDFEILLLAYSYDYEPVKIIDLAKGEQIPQGILADLNNPDVKKVSHNAAFEIYCLSKFYQTAIYQWHCTMVHSLYCGFPASLADVGSVMGFSEDKRKMAIGKSLIRYFCLPCAPSRTNGGRIRNLPAHDEGKWKLFKEYCKQDVVTEMEIHKKLQAHPFPESEHRNWVLDQIINQSGVAMDMQLIEGALEIHAQIKDELSSRAKSITGLDNPNSVAQLKKWIEDNSGLQLDNLNKATVAEVLADKGGKELVREALKIRKELGKTSVKKYETMDSCVCEDGRIRGLLQFYGANRTGRFAGRLVQVQNLPRNYIENLETARELVKRKQIGALKLIYGNVPDTLSQLIRTAFVPSPGNRFVVADFSAIEARVLAWLAGESWRLDIFRTTGKIYEASASTMFGVPVELIAKGNPEYALRSKGKVAELALGYQGGMGALISMGALNMGLTEEELPDIVTRWRKSSPRIVDFWKNVEQYALAAVKLGVSNTLPCGITFYRDEDYLLIRLLSGRELFYYHPVVQVNELGREAIHFWGTNQKSHKWELLSTYGGKLTENIVQAVSRDLLCNAMMNLYYAGYRINFHVHDEVILEVPEDSDKNLEEAIRLMCTLPVWAQGLPLNAAGFESHYYMKD